MSKYFKKGAMNVMEATSEPFERAHWIPNKIFTLPADAIAMNAHIAKMDDMKYICIKNGRNKQYIADVECGFDIENTTIEDAGEYYGYMYIWQFAFGDFLVTGRTWEQFLRMMSEIQNRYPELGYRKTGKKESVQRTVLIGDANEGYEFSYLGRMYFHKHPIVTGVFADSMHHPITSDMSFSDAPAAFQMIDVLRIGSLSLKSLAEDYCTTQKLVGDLDYSKIRNSQTPLTEQEMSYCHNDVIIVHEYMTYYLNTFVRKCKLKPITKTGIVRAAVAHSFIKMNVSVTKLVDMFPDTYDEYSKLMTRLYRGGYTHANYKNVGYVIHNVHGMDYTSSYPACIVQEEMPIEPLKATEAPAVDDLDGYADANKVCWYAKFVLKNVVATTSHSVESLAKIEECFTGNNVTPASKLRAIKQYGIIADNGRILAAKQMTVMLTEQDWDVYRKFYRFDVEEVTDFHEAKRGLLPEYLTEVVKYFYKKKAELKRAGLSDETAYVVAKQCVNALYGLCVQTVHIDNIDFDPNYGWTRELGTPQEEYEKAVHKGEHLRDRYGNVREPQYWLPPQFGIWITAHARRRILSTIYYLGDDAIYSDTDSVYFKHWDAHKELFDKWNEEIIAKNKELFGEDFDLLGDLGTFDPVEIKWKGEDGKKHCSYEYSLKTWGAKRYIKMDDAGHMEQTIAGLPKGTVLKSIKNKHPEWDDKTAAMHCFEVFKGDLKLDLDEANKLTTSYHNSPHSHVVTDEYGNTEVMRELSSVCLYSIPFEMTVDKYYEALVLAANHDAKGD